MPKIDDALERIESLEHFVTKPFDPEEHKDKTRSHIAKLFSWGYLIIIAVAMIGAPIYNIWAKEVVEPRDLLITLSSVIGSPFGFIIGYYFKGSIDKAR